MEVLGIIPARGGSKAIPRKNLVRLVGKPLLAHACAQARGARTLTRVIVSTDDPAIAACARRCGVDVPFMRPRALAADRTPMLPVLRDALRRLRAAEGYRPDIIVVLQPTSPLRSPRDIDAAVRQLIRRRAETVVSVVEVPHQFNPVSVMRRRGAWLAPWRNGRAPLRRQDKPRAYARNGPAVLAVRRAVLEQGRLYGRRTLPLVMPPERSIDIDTRHDLVAAERLMRRARALRRRYAYPVS